jgi:TP901 family phage tail tape measure protein
MALEEKIIVDASGALTGVATLNSTIASIGESLGKLNADLGNTRKAFDSLENKLTKTLRSARDAALSLSKAANEATSSVQKAVSGLASIDTALEKRVEKVRELRAELQKLSGTGLAGGPGRSPGGGGGGPIDPQGIARLGDFSRFNDQLIRQFAIIGQSRAFFFIKDSIEESVSAAKELNARITEIQTISQSAGRSTDSWSKSLIAVSNELGRPVVEVADAAYQTLSNNIRGAEGNTESFLRTVGNFARVTRTTFPGAVDAVSSGLNSYNQSITEAETVTAKFFKAIELGRFRGEELTNAIGKTAPVASQLGVSMDDLLATFIALTRQGNSLNTASTLTLNIFNSLLRPSTELAKFYSSQGVSSGQEFIQVNGGIANALKIIQERSKGALSEITGLFTNLRSSRGIIGITNDINNFNKAIGDVKNAKGQFDIAVGIEKESTNRAIDEFTTRLKNKTITALGDGILTSLGVIAKSNVLSGGIEGAIGLAGPAALGALIPLITQFATKSIIASNALGLMPPLINSMVTGTAAMAANIGLFTVGFTAAYAVGQKLFGITEAQSKAIETTNRQLKERAEFGASGQNNRILNDFQQIENSFTSIQASAARTNSTITRQFEIARVNVKSSFEQLSGSLSSFFNNSRQAIQDINRDISRNLNEIDNSRKSIGVFKASLEKAFLNVKIDLSNPQQQLRLLEDEIERLSNKGKNLIIRAGQTPGTEGLDLLQEGRADLQEAANLTRQRVQALQQIAAANGGNVNSTTLLNQLERDSLGVLNAKVQAEQTYQKLKKEETVRLEEAKKAEEERLTRLRIFSKEFEKIQVQIASGDITKDKQFLKNGVFDPEAVKTELAKLGLAIQAALTNSGDAVNIQFSKDLADATIKANQFLNTTILHQEAERQSKQLIQEREAAKTRADALKEINAELIGGLKEPNKRGLAGASDQLDATIKNISQRSIFTIDNQELEAQDRTVNQLKDIKTLVDSIKNNPTTKDGLTLFTPEQLAQLEAARIALERFGQATKGLTITSLTGVTVKVDDTINQANTDIQNSLNLAARSQALLQQNQEAASQINTLQNTNVNEFKNALNTLTEITNQSSQAFQEALDGLTNRINSIGNGGGEVRRNSHGGTQMGMDTHLAAVRQGEVILNPTASKNFASQLQAMNHMSSIPYGNSQNVSVGDVNVYVSGSDTSEQTVRKIGHGLRREFRRGNLRF